MRIRKLGYFVTMCALLAFMSACTINPVTLPTEIPAEEGQDAAPVAAEEGPPAVPTEVSSSATTATDYCVEQGGQVVTRRATYGTDGESSGWVALHEVRDFCEFTAADGASSVSLDVDTLWSTEPTLATLAYYEPTPLDKIGGNPTSLSYCTQLGGTANFEVLTGKVGSWALEGSEQGEAQSEAQVVAYCLFPDNSTLDLEGLFAHADGNVVGVDLRTVLHYRPAQLPVIYPDGEPYETTAPGVPALEVMPNVVPEANADASAYCEEHGGQVILRTFFYGTNNDRSNWLQLATPLYFCEFEAQAGGSADAGSRISIDLESLYSEEPTLAAMAYLNAIPVGDIPPGVNPAPVYCGQLGGSSSPTGPENVAGGGWVNEDVPVFTVMSMCVFADGSMIEEWGITYHAAGAIRGADLSQILRYSPE